MGRLALIAVLSIAAGFALGALARPREPVGETLAQQALIALQLPDRNERMRALLALLDEIDPKEAGVVADLMVSKAVVVTDCEIRPFARAIVDKDFDAGMRLIQGWGDENPNREGLVEVAHGLVLAGKLAEARELARTRLSEERREPLVTGLVAAWAEIGDLDALGKYLYRLPDGGRLNQLIDPLLRALIRRAGLQPAMDWVHALPDDTAQNGPARGTFLLMLRFATIQDPALGVAWYAANADRPRALSGRGVVAAEWIEHDPEAASSWLLEQPDSFESRTALFSGVERWLELDPETAEAWIHAHREQPLATAGIRPLVRHIAYDRPLDAIAWSERIPDDDLRHRTLGQALQIWLEVDEAAAQRWIAEATDLPLVTRRMIGRRIQGDAASGRDAQRRAHEDC